MSLSCTMLCLKCLIINFARSNLSLQRICHLANLCEMFRLFGTYPFVSMAFVCISLDYNCWKFLHGINFLYTDSNKRRKSSTILFIGKTDITHKYDHSSNRTAFLILFIYLTTQCKGKKNNNCNILGFKYINPYKPMGQSNTIACR